ncbi:MAG: MATE family efflux transporter [Oscillospiraceae bacterium]|jgi:putative MATE family efflux protein|nr:MATE family efflux transporter [Oscillospiraceae bacterium]
MKNTLTLTEGSIWKVLIRFAVPFLLSGLFQVLYGTVDVYFIGHYASGASISGVASANQAMAMITQIFMGLTLGGTVLIGQFMGAEHRDDAAKVTGNMVLMFLAIGVFCTLILTLGNNAINSLMKVPTEEALSEANAYMFVCGCGTIFIMGYNVVSSILRGLGNSKAPLYFIAISCSVNILLDYVFVALLHMSAAGAALATIISQGLSLGIGLLYIKRTGLPFEFKRSYLRPDGVFIKRILKIGAPAALQNTMIGFSFSMITTITNGLGEAASAGAGVVGRAIDICMMIPSSFGNAITSITAQNIGAGKPERAIKTMWLGIAFSLVFAIPYTLLGSFAPKVIIGLLADAPDVIKQGALYLVPFSWDCILVSFVFCFNGFFNGFGKSLFTMAHNLATTFLIRIPIVWVMSRMPDVTMFQVGIGTPVATFASLVICLVYLKLRFSGERLRNLSALG